MRAAVDAQRPEREVAGVEMVLEIEDAREAGTVPEEVFPGTVWPLRAQQIGNTVVDRGAGRPTKKERRDIEKLKTN